MRRILKRWAEFALVRSGFADVWRRTSGRDAVVLAYHNVVPDGDSALGDSSLHLPMAAFVAQMDLVSETHSIVPLEDLLRGRTGEEKPLAAVTFDDAYLGSIKLGVRELVRRGLPATVFVCPGLLGAQGFWWDRVSDPTSGAVPRSFRRLTLQDLGGRQRLILERAEALGLLGAPLPELYRPASEEDLDALTGHPLITLGSHTWSHVHLPSMPRPEAEEELRRSLAWVQKRNPAGPSLLSYPYGAFREDLEATVRKVGYEAAFLAHGGPTRVRELPRSLLTIPRLNVPRGLSTEGLRARLSGAWPR